MLLKRVITAVPKSSRAAGRYWLVTLECGHDRTLRSGGVPMQASCRICTGRPGQRPSHLTIRPEHPSPKLDYVFQQRSQPMASL